jgi:hypothetical protein
MPFCSHWQTRQLPAIFSCKNIPTTSALTNKIYGGKKPCIVPLGGNWVVTWGQQCKW